MVSRGHYLLLTMAGTKTPAQGLLDFSVSL